MQSRRAFRALCVLASLPALAGSLFLNGVNIDGVTDQKFEKVTVRIDEKGNIYLDAPGYAVRQVDTPAPAAKEPAPSAVPGKVTKRYFLVTEQNVTGMTDFDIDVYVNSKWIRKLRNDEDQIVTEVTRHLLPGKNVVLISAKKLPGETRRSQSAEHMFRVIIGEGNVGGDNVMIDNPLITFKRTAAEPADVSQEFPLVTR